jgi:hypothetical protein
MSEQYDDTNKGVIFEPGVDERFVGVGKLDIDGKFHSIVLVQKPLKKDGKPQLVLYQKMGVFLPNTHDRDGNPITNEKAPRFTGPMDDHPGKRLSVWTGEKNDRKYMQIKVDDRQGGSGASEKPSQHEGGSDPWANDPDDYIPF